MPKIPINGPLSLSQNIPNVDGRFGPYTSVAEANEYLGPAVNPTDEYDDVISAGMLFGVYEDDGSVTICMWTKDHATVNDFKRISHAQVVQFNGIVTGIVSINQSSGATAKTASDIKYLEQNKKFGYLQGSGYIVNWVNRYIWADASQNPYNDVLYLNIATNALYYYTGTALVALTAGSQGSLVTSVNGQTGAVTITIPTKLSDLTNDVGFITNAGVTSFNGQTGAVTYTPPVTSVNSKTGAVVLDKTDVGLGNVDNTPDANKQVYSAVHDGSGNPIDETYETKTHATAQHSLLQSNIDSLSNVAANLTGLEGTNFGGFSLASDAATAVSNIPTVFTQNGCTVGQPYWFLAGPDMSALVAYRYIGSGTPAAISATEYDFTDFSRLSEQVKDFKGTITTLSAIDDLHNVADVGVYHVKVSQFSGLLIVEKFNDGLNTTITQQLIASGTPVNQGGSYTIESGQTLARRTYSGSAWTSWTDPIAELQANVAALGPKISQFYLATYGKVFSESASTAHSYLAGPFLKGHTYRIRKTSNYTYTSNARIYFRVTEGESAGQSSQQTLYTNQSYIDFTADKDYGVMSLYNPTTTAGGTQEVVVYDVSGIAKEIAEEAATEKANGVKFSTNQLLSSVGIDSAPTSGSDNVVKSGGVYTELHKVSDAVNLYTIKDVALTKQGSIITAVGYIITPFIPVTEGDTIKVCGYTGGASVNRSLVCFYSSTNTADFISAAGNDGEQGEAQVSLTVPSGAKYMVCETVTTMLASSYVASPAISALVKEYPNILKITTIEQSLTNVLGKSVSITADVEAATAKLVPLVMPKDSVVKLTKTPNRTSDVYLRYYGGSSSSQYQQLVTWDANGNATITCDKDYDNVLIYRTNGVEITFTIEVVGQLKNHEERITALESASPSPTPTPTESTPNVKVAGVSSTAFDVYVYSKAAGKYMRHRFIKMYDERDMTYGDSQTKHLVTCDCWYPDITYDDADNRIVQGNINFINRISPSAGDFAGEGYYVGEGHGCAVSVFTKCLVDGVEIDPISLGDTIVTGDNFRFLEKVNYYACNNSLTSQSRSYPKLDENGDMILACVHYADALFEEGNRITVWNRMTVKRDGTKFGDAYAGMFRVYLPHFNKVYLSDPDHSANSFSHDGTNWTIADIGGSGIVLENGTDHFLMGSNIVFTGEKYTISQTIEQKSRPWDKLCFRNTLYNDNIKSVKIYQCPIFAQSHATAMGGTAEILNDGDVIECKIVRKIDFNPTT